MPVEDISQFEIRLRNRLRDLDARLSDSGESIVGGEAAGIPQAVLDRCDAVTRLPMAGFVASYNLQAAVAAIALERIRQTEESP